MTDTIETAGLIRDGEVVAMQHTDTVVQGHRDTIGRLESMLAATRTRAEHAERLHREDIALIGSSLIDEANSREWCSEYDAVVERLNRHLNVELPLREQDYTVTVNVTLSISVSARDEEHAKVLAGEIARQAERDLDEMGGVTSSVEDSYSWEVEQD